MARIEVHPDRLIVKLSAAEKTLSLRHRDLVLERNAISSATITNDPWVWIRGVRSPGAHVPRSLAIGTWRGESGKAFVLVRSGKPAIVIDFSLPFGAEPEDKWVGEFDAYARVIVSTEHAEELMRALKLDDSNAAQSLRKKNKSKKSKAGS